MSKAGIIVDTYRAVIKKSLPISSKVNGANDPSPISAMWNFFLNICSTVYADLHSRKSS